MNEAFFYLSLIIAMGSGFMIPIGGYFLLMGIDNFDRNLGGGGDYFIASLFGIPFGLFAIWMSGYPVWEFIRIFLISSVIFTGFFILFTLPKVLQIRKDRKILNTELKILRKSPSYHFVDGNDDNNIDWKATNEMNRKNHEKGI